MRRSIEREFEALEADIWEARRHVSSGGGGAKVAAERRAAHRSALAKLRPPPPQVASVALLLAAFCADPRDGWAFAGDDLLQDASLQPLLAALLGRDGAAKPMDCVGTPREVALCVARARDAYAAAGLPLPVLLAGPRAEADAEEGRRHAGMLLATDGQHALPRWAAAACGADPARYVGPPEQE